MYESFYGLKERPFDLTANPRFLFLTAGHREALSNLQYGLSTGKGITLLIGEAGTGKTTLIRAAMEQLKTPASCLAYLSNPTLTRQEFYEFLGYSLRMPPDATQSKARFLNELQDLALERRRAGGLTAVVVDEAQSLPHELLEEIRLLSNLETATEKLVPIVLAGQPELSDRLNDTSLRQLKQRVALRCSLPPLDLRETAAYIAKRIRIAGGDSGQVFTREAVQAIYDRSGGIPRTISVLCDNALVTGFALGRRPVGAEVVAEVGQDFDFRPDEHEAAAASGSAAPRAEDHRPGFRVVPGAQAAPAVGFAEPSPRPKPAPVPEPQPEERRAAAGGREFFSMFTRRRKFLFFG